MRGSDESPLRPKFEQALDCVAVRVIESRRMSAIAGRSPAIAGYRCQSRIPDEHHSNRCRRRHDSVPQARGRRALSVMAAAAAKAALADAHVAYEDVEQAYAGFVYGDSTAGQRALYEVGMTGLPIVNVNNNCATGSTALFLARQAVASGSAECVLALGFEQMEPGAIGTKFNDRPTPFDRFDDETDAARSACPKWRSRCVISAAPALLTCGPSVRRSRRSRRSAPRPAATPRRTPWRSSGRRSRPSRSSSRP